MKYSLNFFFFFCITLGHGSPTFLAPGTGFVEDGVGMVSGWFEHVTFIEFTEREAEPRWYYKQWGAARNTDEALLSCLLLTSCCGSCSWGWGPLVLATSPSDCGSEAPEWNRHLFLSLVLFLSCTSFLLKKISLHHFSHYRWLIRSETPRE